MFTLRRPEGLNELKSELSLACGWGKGAPAESYGHGEGSFVPQSILAIRQAVWWFCSSLRTELV